DECEPVAHDGHPSLASTSVAGENRLADHPPACANVCVAASARPLANTQVGAFDATRQSSVAQLAEQPAVNRQVTGSSPVGGARSPVAQLAEQPAVNRQVTGSSPVGGAC